MVNDVNSWTLRIVSSRSGENFSTSCGNKNRMLKLCGRTTICCQNCPFVRPRYKLGGSNGENWLCLTKGNRQFVKDGIYNAIHQVLIRECSLTKRKCLTLNHIFKIIIICTHKKRLVSSEKLYH